MQERPSARLEEYPRGLLSSSLWSSSPSTWLPTCSCGPSQISLSSTRYHLAVLAVNLPKAAFLLYIIAVSDGLGPFGLGGLRPKDVVRGLLCALGAATVIIVPGLLFSAFGIENSFLVQARSGPRASASLIPLFLASSMSTGYCEELFFRSYLLRRLGQVGLPPKWAAIVSALIFGLGHGYQGPVGLFRPVSSAYSSPGAGSTRRTSTRSPFGHGLFDAAVFAIALYS